MDVGLRRGVIKVVQLELSGRFNSSLLRLLILVEDAVLIMRGKRGYNAEEGCG